MSETNGVPPLMTIKDLQARWGVSADCVMGHIDDKAHPLPAIRIGRGKRPEYRFRLSSIEAWERAAEKTAAASPDAPSPAAAIELDKAGWDGKKRLAGRKPSRPRA